MIKNSHESKCGKGIQDFTDLGIKSLRISDLVIDDRNTNKGTDLGKDLLRTSVSRFGAGRGVLVDRNLKLIAGNHSVIELERQGIENILVVPTDGKTLVVTQRVDIDKDSKEGHELAIADNRVSQANICFDTDVIQELDAEFSLDLVDFAFNLGDNAELGSGNYSTEETIKEGSNVKATGGNETKQGQFDQTFFPLSVVLSLEQRQSFDTWKTIHKCTSDTEAFLKMLNRLLEYEP